MKWRTDNGFDYAPAPDPLWRRTPEVFRARYSLLGIPFEFTTNAPSIAALAEETFRIWGPPPEDDVAPPIQIQVTLQDSTTSGCAALKIRAHRDTLVITKGNSVAYVHRNSGISGMWISTELMNDFDLVRTMFLECPALFLICRHRAASLHAAAVVIHDRCVLLTGPSGAGKSTLAYACVRAGFQLLAEDIVYVDHVNRTAWGSPWHLNLLPDAVRFFPELIGVRENVQPNGEKKLRIKTDSVHPTAAVCSARIHAVCSLGRSGGSVSHILEGDGVTIYRCLTEFGDDPILDYEAMRLGATTALEASLGHLEMGEDPNEAATRIREWIAP